MDGYNIEFDDGSIRRVEGSNAGNAIFKALSEYRGHRVKRCFRGGLAQDMHAAGIEEFEVPPHRAQDPEVTAEKQKVTLRVPTQTEVFEAFKDLVGGTREVRS